MLFEVFVVGVFVFVELKDVYYVMFEVVKKYKLVFFVDLKNLDEIKLVGNLEFVECLYGLCGFS